jgi:hypothetical protein
VKPTHICLDCGAVGHAGGYHDHGGGNAGDTASIAEVLQQLQRGGAALDALARVREVLDEVSWDAPSDRQAE